MTSLREQIEALPKKLNGYWVAEKSETISRAAVLNIIDQHRCIPDRDALARALQETILTSIDKYRGPGGGAYRTPWADLTAVARRHVLQDADAILAALKEQDDAKD